MENATLTITVVTLTRIIVPPLYLLVGVIVYRWLAPQLSPTSIRLASLLLAAQLLIIGKSIFLEPSSSFDAWLWNLHMEWNLPATLASTQLALAGAVAWSAAWLTRPRLALPTLYLLGLGAVLLFLAFDEYFTLHEFWTTWNYYLALGAAVVAATLLMALRSPPRLRKWQLCLLIGLSISALGAIQVERFGGICGDYGLVYIRDCPPNPNWEMEEVLEFLGIWLVLIAMLGHFSAADRAPSLRLRRLLYAFSALWILLIVPNARIWPLARQAYAQPATVSYASGATLLAYQVQERQQDLTVHLFISPAQWEYDGLGYSIYLADQVSGETIHSRSTRAHRRLEFFLAPGYQPAYRQWTRLAYPAAAPKNRALWVVVSLWQKEGDQYLPEPIVSSDRRLLSDTKILLDDLVLKDVSVEAAAQPIARFNVGFALEAVEMPKTAAPGEALPIAFNWRSDADGSEDYAQFLHLGHAETGEYFVYDQLPLGDRLPTRLWYAGLADSETWSVPLPADLAPGEYRVFTGLYRVSDGERLPVTDADGAPWLDNRVALGKMIIEG